MEVRRDPNKIQRLFWGYRHEPNSEKGFKAFLFDESKGQTRDSLAKEGWVDSPDKAYKGFKGEAFGGAPAPVNLNKYIEKSEADLMLEKILKENEELKRERDLYMSGDAKRELDLKNEEDADIKEDAYKHIDNQNGKSKAAAELSNEAKAGAAAQKPKKLTKAEREKAEREIAGDAQSKIEQTKPDNTKPDSDAESNSESESDEDVF